MIDEVYRCIEARAANPVFIHLLPRARVEERLRSIESVARGAGTAGGGGVRAAFNNRVGPRPRRGLVSTRGVVPACRSLDCVSIFARGCADAAAILEVLQGRDSHDPYSRSGEEVALPLKAFRFAVPRQLEFHGDRAYEALFGKAHARLAELGGRRVDIGFAPFLEAQALPHGPWIAEPAAEGFPLEGILPVTRQIFQSGARHSAADLFKAQHRLAELKRDCAGLLASADVLVGPRAPTIYRIAGGEGEPGRTKAPLGRYTQLGNPLALAALAPPPGA